MSEAQGEIRAVCRDSKDRLACTYDVIRFARRVGMSPRAASELAICVAELLGNSVHHGGGQGRWVVRLVAAPRRAIEVEVSDDGPGIAAVELAVRDGFTRGRFREPGTPCFAGPGLGVGLSAVRRFADHLEVKSAPGGTSIVMRKHL